MNTLTAATIQMELKAALPALECRILVHEIEVLSERIAKLEGNLTERVISVLDEVSALRYRIYSEFQELNRDLPLLRTNDDKTERCLEFLTCIKLTEKLSEDRKAFNRWMDITAVRERARIAMHESDRTGEMVLHLLRQALLARFGNLTAKEMTAELERLEIPRRLETEFNDSPRWQNLVVVLKVWEGLMRSLPSGNRDAIWSEKWEQRIAELMSAPEENPWVQVQAFKTMAVYDPEKCLAMIHHRFISPDQSGDDIFLRSDLLEVLQENYTVKNLNIIIRDIFQRPDPSEHVRIKAGLKLALLPADQNLQIIAEILDPETEKPDTEKVRAAVAISLGKLVTKAELSNKTEPVISKLLGIIESSLSKKTVSRIQEALVEGLSGFATAHAKQCPGDKIDALDHRILKCLDHTISNSGFHDRARRLASETREWIILNRDPDARELMDRIESYRYKLQFGDSFSVPVENIPGEILLGRVLAWASVGDFGYYAQPGRSSWRIWRGIKYKRKAWRILHELTHPDPAKRQGFVHTTGRSFPGRIRAHARYLAETTETKVPGERLFHQNEHSWRPYLPTVDDLLSLSNSKFAGKSIKIFSSEGVFTFKGLSNLQDRLMIWWDITVNYRSIVEHRNVDIVDVQKGHSRSFAQYIAENLNIEIGFEPHRYEFDGKFYQVIDPVVANHLYPAVRNQMEWRPLI
ncbi:hypothetical protein K8T06_11750 [bacterium]|nr:hypothetical protein [bacterium]